MDTTITIKCTPQDLDDLRKAVEESHDQHSAWSRDTDLNAASRQMHRAATARMLELRKKL